MSTKKEAASPLQQKDSKLDLLDLQKFIGTLALCSSTCIEGVTKALLLLFQSFPLKVCDVWFERLRLAVNKGDKRVIEQGSIICQACFILMGKANV